jgi:hypothetical protein
MRSHKSRALSAAIGFVAAIGAGPDRAYCAAEGSSFAHVCELGCELGADLLHEE